MHYGHTNPHSHLIQDQCALGVDTHFTFSTDILTQARIWLQSARCRMYNSVLDTWRIPRNNPMSVNQAFLLATRHGALALRRPDLGVLATGAKADLVVWNGRSPSLLGWTDPVAAIILHANVGDIDHVLVDGQASIGSYGFCAWYYVWIGQRDVCLLCQVLELFPESWKQQALVALAQVQQKSSTCIGCTTR